MPTHKKTKVLPNKEGKKSYHHGGLRQAVTEAAVRLMIERGEVTFSLREIAAAMKVSHAALYRHFANKREILAVVAEDGLIKLMQCLKEGAAGNVGHSQLSIKNLFTSYVQFAIEYPGHFRAMSHQELSERSDLPQLAALSQAAGDQLLDMARRILQANPKRQESAEGVALSIWSLAHGLADLIINRQFPSARSNDPKMIAKRIEEVAAIIWDGLK